MGSFIHLSTADSDFATIHNLSGQRCWQDRSDRRPAPRHRNPGRVLDLSGSVWVIVMFHYLSVSFTFFHYVSLQVNWNKIWGLPPFGDDSPVIYQYSFEITFMDIKTQKGNLVNTTRRMSPEFSTGCRNRVIKIYIVGQFHGKLYYRTQSLLKLNDRKMTYSFKWENLLFAIMFKTVSLSDSAPMPSCRSLEMPWPFWLALTCSSLGRWYLPFGPSVSDLRFFKGVGLPRFPGWNGAYGHLRPRMWTCVQLWVLYSTAYLVWYSIQFYRLNSHVLSWRFVHVWRIKACQKKNMCVYMCVCMMTCLSL